MIERITREEFYKNIDSFLSCDKEQTLYWIYDHTAVNYGYNNDCNIEWCKSHNIETNDAKRGGGCIVSTTGNINLVDIRIFKKGEWFANKILHKFVQYLKEKGLDAKFDNNDVMVDGYKVASGVNVTLKPDYKILYSGIQFSINQDYNVIEYACLKKCKKKPKGLSEFGITTDDVEKWIKEKEREF